MNQESELNKTWEQIASDWKTQPVKHIDSAELLHKIKKRVWWSKALFGLNVLATAFCLAGFAWGLFSGKLDIPTLAFLGFCGLFSLLFVRYEYVIRRKLWQFKDGGPEQALLDAIESCESTIRYCNLNFVSLIPMFPAGNLYLYVSAQEANKPMITGFILVNLFLALIGLIFVILKKKRQRELKQLQQMQENSD